jgi:xylulokinase
MTLVEQSPPGARHVLFLPHLAGERSPHLDPDTRGAWVNLSLAHTQADVVRSVLEGVAFGLREALQVVRAIAPVEQLVATGGGARSPLWLKILADILQLPLIAPQLEEGAAYGAAILAMVGVGVYPNLEETFNLLPHSESVMQPQVNLVYEEAFTRYQALYEALKVAR